MTSAEQTMFLDDRYRLEGELGRGGMGVVYRARDTLLSRDVAIKLLGGPALAEESYDQILLEARAAARMDHPNIVTVFDVSAEQGAPFIVMQLVRGETLRHIVPLEIPQAVQLGIQLCAALGHAHMRGVVHRDIKPENVLMTGPAERRTARLTDFGVARIQDAPSISKDDRLAGSLLYLSPEQILMQQVDARADLYALGVLLYETLAGRAPFEGSDPISIISQHLEADPPSLADLRENVPPELTTIIFRLLEKKPEDRFSSARDVSLALSDLERRSFESLTQELGNLPTALTAFVGREEDQSRLKEIIEEARLVTLTGPGGVGKTRLALEVAAGLRNTYEDGVWFLDIAPLEDSQLVQSALAGVLGMQERPSEPLIDVLREHIRDMSTLLVMDNCEHLIETCSEFAQNLLKSSPNLKILATSQEPLQISGERLLRVGPLSTPDSDTEVAPASLSRYDSARLLIDRIQATSPEFRVTSNNAASIARICSQLDGIPLALELAASRANTLSTQEISARLDDRFSLLEIASRTARPSHQTLRALLEWSYELLTEKERLLLRRLASFAGSFTMEAAEAVCGDEQIVSWEVLSLLVSLADKSLVVVESTRQATRYCLLRTVRQYALEELNESGEEESTRITHLDYYLNLAEEAEPELHGPAVADTMEQLERALPDFAAAMDFASQNDDMMQKAIRLAGALASYLDIAGRYDIASTSLAAALAGTGSSKPTPALGKAVALAATSAWRAGNSTKAKSLCDDALEVASSTGDKPGEARALHLLGNLSAMAGDYENAREKLLRALQIREAEGEAWEAASSLNSLGIVSLHSGNLAAAEKHYKKALEISKKNDDKRMMVMLLNNLGRLANTAGDQTLSRPYYEDSLYLARQVHDRLTMPYALINLAAIERVEGNLERASERLKDALVIILETRDQFVLASTYEELSMLASAHGDHIEAARFYGAADAVAKEAGISRPQIDQNNLDRSLAVVAEAIGEEAFGDTELEGHDMEISNAIEWLQKLFTEVNEGTEMASS